MRRARNILGLAMGLLGLAMGMGGLFAFQKPFRQYPGVEYSRFETPPDWNVPAEFVFARLMYPNGGPMDGYFPRFQGDWRLGLSLWTQDYPRADRHFLQALMRLSRVNARTVEQPVNLDEGEEFDLPFLYAVQVGEWALTEKQGEELREYILRGGYFMADDLHGRAEHNEFTSRIAYAFPDRQVVEVPDSDGILQEPYTFNPRIQIPGQAHVRAGCKNCEDGGRGAHFQAIYDDKGRVIVGLTYNDDVGDGWEWADDPYYPEASASAAIRIGVNEVVYAMTH